MIRKLLIEEDAFAITEYAIVIGLVSLGAMSAFITLGGRLRGFLDLVQEYLGRLPS